MKTMIRNMFIAAMICGISVGASVAEMTVDGVVSLSPVLDHSCIAVELQVDPGSTIAGVRWFHNDAGVAFPSLLLMEGAGNTAPDLSQVALILDEVTGESLAWGSVMLDEPVTTQTGIVYAIFELPSESERTGEGLGGGPGIGYAYSDTATPAFMSSDGVNWARLQRDVQLEVELVLGGAMRTAGSPKLLAEARESRRAGWWDDLARAEDVLDKAADSGSTAPSIVHAGRRLAATPNPFNPRTEVYFFLSALGRVEIDVFDVRGRLVSKLIRGDYAPGQHSVMWDGTDSANRTVASGVYYLRMTSPDGVNDIRVTLVR